MTPRAIYNSFQLLIAALVRGDEQEVIAQLEHLTGRK